MFDLGPNDHLKNVDFFLAPFKKGRWENYNYLEHGLAHQDVQVIYQAKNGVMWFKTRGGISLFDGSKFTTIEITGGSYHATGGIYEDEHGVIWFGTSKGGVFQYVNNQIVNFLPDSEINQVEVFDIKKGHDNTIWLGTRNGLFQYKGRTLTRFTIEDGLAKNDIQQILVDHSGKLWLCHDSRNIETGKGQGLTFFDGDRFHIFTTLDGLPSNIITSACQGVSEDIWIGTYKGLVSYNGSLSEPILSKMDW